MRIVLIVLVALMAGSLPADADRGGHSGRGGHFGHSSHFVHGGHFGHSSHFVHGGHFGHSGHFHGGHSHSSVSFGVVIGPQWWGPGWWGSYPYYPYYPTQPVVVQQPVTYVQPQSQETGYWYFCQQPEGYYPYVKKCPKGWMKVIPPANPPAAEE